ncbi:phosphoesterase RecJ-like protein [Roseivirga ehrenbergii]|uniref:Exopolyphosphatase n=1 Tax=Roseivirga ehrenbergii (strain DSM 102268 / JCM 13514 / KCTC 12282 / NCIMB 14502 / KMM 6017) TaxID=279360 RepID=A0A150XTK3_ROSEK|nr:bifunctional oligoribonuclease/PAP phosphatase NrnA [Roseivirga ehrenbergii]KYG82070.1 exopolyphosphatase [Roseivirga ehrenbergii]TCL01892.1 phosphoesterase RecJ-like protein [Roseivirga ehrenbergii]
MGDINSLIKQLNTSNKIVITTHHKPDADALGSSLGMANYLIKKGHNVKVITPSDYPGFLNWMKGNDNVLVYSDENSEQVQRFINEADTIITLDFSVLHRINEMGEMVRNAKAFKVNVDHHLEPEDFADYRLWDTKAASTCELCFELIVMLGDKALIDKDIAECLYAGIMTDTGGFRHPNTTQNVHEVVAELIGIGADNAKIAKEIYDTNSLNRLKFLGFALSQKLEVLPEFHTAYFAITNDELNQFESKTGDTEGLVNYALSLEGIVLAVLFKDSGDGIKMSFRSIGEFPANEIASKYFNGGGHRNAAGGKTEGTLEETVDKFKSILKDYKPLLDSEKNE